MVRQIGPISFDKNLPDSKIALLKIGQLMIANIFLQKDSAVYLLIRHTISGLMHINFVSVSSTILTL